MTRLYAWNPMPHVLAVGCPECTTEAVFEFAEMALIAKNADLPYFAASKDFEVQRHYSNGWKNVAIFWHQIGRPLHAISDLPEGYRHADWEHSPYLVRKGPGDFGTVVCARCGLRRKHVLNWPGDAFFRIEYRGKVLWAFDRSSIAALIAFVESEERDAASHGWEGFLRKVPAHFLLAKARKTVLRRLRAKMYG